MRTVDAWNGGDLLATIRLLMHIRGYTGRQMFDTIKRIFARTGSTQNESIADESALKGWRDDALDGRRIAYFVPQQAEPPTGVVLFLHGHGRVLLDGNVTFSKLLQRFNLVAVCPDAGQSWWLDVVCDEFDSEFTPQAWIMQRVVPWISSRFAIEPPRIALLGVSMGGQGALQLAYRNASRFPVVAAIAPAVDFDQLYGSGIPLDRMFPNRESARQATVVLNLQPLSWPRHQWFCCDPTDTEWFDGAARLGMKLSSSGILHERDLTTTGGGHSWDYFNRMATPAIEHIATSLRKLAASG